MKEVLGIHISEKLKKENNENLINYEIVNLVN